MRKLNVRGQAPAYLAAREPSALQAVERQLAAGKRSASFQSGLYGSDDVREALFLMHYGKCCYCEAQIEPVATAEVEHYRPKGAVINEITGETLKPGYYWLAYNWDNLLISCPKCNSVKYKGNRFPLLDELTRDLPNKDISSEHPLLINPSITDPSDLIRFRFGVAYAVGNDIRAQTTIDVLGLNRETLVDARREFLRLLKIVANAAASEVRETERLAAEAMLAELLADTAPYTACVRDDLR